MQYVGHAGRILLGYISWLSVQGYLSRGIFSSEGHVPYMASLRVREPVVAQAGKRGVSEGVPRNPAFLMHEKKVYGPSRNPAPNYAR